MSFWPKSAPKPKQTAAVSPVHLAARREWNELHGVAKSRERAWRAVAFCSIALAGYAFWSFKQEADKSKIVPFVVASDRLGEEVAVKRADVVLPTDPRVIRMDIARWVHDWRAVSTDVEAEKHYIHNVFNHIDGTGRAATVMKDWFTKNQPFQRAFSEGPVAAEVLTVVPLSANTWQATWREDHSGTLTNQARTEYWTANIQISVRPPTTDKEILQNASGTYVEWLDWSQVPSK